MSRERKHVPASDKLAILKEYLIERKPISDLCDQHGIQPSQVYRWQSLLFEHGAGALDRKPGRQARRANTAARSNGAAIMVRAPGAEDGRPGAGVGGYRNR